MNAAGACRIGFWLSALVVLLVLAGCVATPPGPRPLPPVATGEPSLAAMGYSIQVGAFAAQDNAARLEAGFLAQGLDAYTFRDRDNLFKVRFGNHASYQEARAQAESLRARGVISEFFIVFPQDYPLARIGRAQGEMLRGELVSTARGFLGIPYRWGGTSAEEGFDCSGLTLMTYRLNGLDLPRNSASQYAAGRPIPASQLRQGDLVFFATRGGPTVSHVGLYIGGGRFIHAPRSGQNVQVESLSNSYYQRTFVGARSYL